MALSFENISTILNYVLKNIELKFENISSDLNFNSINNDLKYENTSTVLNFDVYDYGAEWPMFYALLDFLGISYSLNDVFQSDET